MRPERTYFYRGPIERGKDYQWKDGYSRAGENGEIWYPWLTKKECQTEAKRDGFKAVFVDNK